MKSRTIWTLAVLTITLSLLLASCTSQPTQTPTTPPATEKPAEPTTELTIEPSTEPPPDKIHTITILYTNDEHGYLDGVEEGLGAAEMMGIWKDEFDYTPDGPFLVLSGGDMWFGAAISSWFEGASMVEIMNAMGYAAGVVGNHEFDKGLSVLSTRVSEMNFPLLSANLRYKSDGSVPTDLGIQPYVLVEVDGVTIGIIGLSLMDTPLVTDPRIVAPFDFTDYEAALREFVPIVREEGAEIIVVPAHICQYELAPLAEAVSDLGISMFGGGHCHETFSGLVGDAVLLGGGSLLQGFAYAQITYDSETGDISITDYGTMNNYPGNPDPIIAGIADEWKAEAELILNQVIGYLDETIYRESETMYQWVAESWLWAFPSADVALTNTGGIRTDIFAGEITYGDIYSLLPFDNTIIQLTLTGAQLQQALNMWGDGFAIGGVDYTGGRWILAKTGEAINPGSTYIVLVNSYMYSGGEGLTFHEMDPDGYDTTVHYRQPLLDWIQAQDSSEALPLDPLIQALIETP